MMTTKCLPSLIAFVWLSVMAGHIHAATIKNGSIACLSEELFDQMIHATVEHDPDGQQYLLKNGCIVIGRDFRASVLQRTFGKAKLRIYTGKDAVVIWTNIESVAP
jgi:hypothetical protein